MVDVKEAVKKAMEFFQDIFRGEDLKDVLLEEVELSTDGYWYVTLGFTKHSPELVSPMEQITRGVSAYRRLYKVFKVDTQTGEVKSMKIRSND